MLSVACCVGWKVKGFGGDEKEVDDDDGRDVDELDGEDEDEEEADEEGVADDVVESDSESESESLPSEASESFCFEEGNTIGARTDRPGISNVVLGDLLRFLRCVISSCFVSISTSEST